MSESIDTNELVDRRKMARAVMLHTDRFAWSEAHGRLVLDRRGDIVFMSDVIKIIEGKKP